MSRIEIGSSSEVVNSAFSADLSGPPGLPQRGIVSPANISSYPQGVSGNIAERLRHFNEAGRGEHHVPGAFPVVEQRPSGILVPKAISTAEDAVPAIDTASTGLIVPRDDELLAYGAPDITANDEDTPHRGSTELARALANPTLFAIKEAKGQTKDDVEATDVLDLFEDGLGVKKGGAEKALSRRVTEKVFYDRTKGEHDVVIQSRPGPVETAAIAMTTLLDDPDIKPMAGSVVLKPLKTLLQYNVAIFEDDVVTPEMPDLTQKLISALPRFPAERGEIYDILGDLLLPESQQKELMDQMAERGELERGHAHRLFVTNRINRQLGPNVSIGSQEVIRNIHDKSASIIYTPELYDNDDLERATSQGDAPGYVETVALAAMEAIDDPLYKEHADTLVIAPVIRLIKNYRMHGIYMLRVPEMPDLTDTVVAAIDSFPDQPAVRDRLYDLLEQITLPVTVTEGLLEKMDAHGDLAHPLAFQSTVQLAEQKPDAPWLATQQERRDYLLYSLGGSNQELMERYDEFVETARGLVYSGDARDPRGGMVGFEVELYANDFIKSLSTGAHPEDYAETSNALINSYDGAWYMDVDGEDDDWDPVYNELQKLDDALDHNKEYLTDLVRLRQFLGDSAQYITSLHLHLDRDEHPHMPNLGHLYQGYSHQKVNVSPSQTHNTWEMRGFNLPRANGNVHPGRIEDIILMNISAAAAPPPDNPTLLEVPTDTTVDQLKWGHLVTHIEDAEGRLAALMAMQDTMALASINPMAFLHSVREEDFGNVLSVLGDELPSDEDRALCSFMKGIVTGNEPRDYGSNALFVAEHIVRGTKYEKILRDLVYGSYYEDSEPENTPVIAFRPQTLQNE